MLPHCATGTTATVVIVDPRSRQIACCNAGDSSVRLVDRTRAGWVSADHRLQENADEQKRLVALGAHLAYAVNPATKLPAGPMRIWPGGLILSRSLGDADCPCELISPEPHCEVFSVAEPGVCIVLGTAGLWDALDSRQVDKLCRKLKTAQECATELVAAAVRNRCMCM